MFGEMIGTISDFMYSYLLIIMLLAVGLYFTIRTRGVQLRLLAESIRVVGEKSSSRESVSAFQALMVSTASRVGTGNIVGVANAIAVGGYGAVFWMWIIALLGGASAFIESTLAQIYKVRDKNGGSYGGPSYYIQAALKSRWLGVVFAAALIATYAGGFNMLASFNLIDSMSGYSFYGDPQTSLVPLVGGGLLAVLVAVCVLGGGRRIVRITGLLVPFMGVTYILMALVVMALNFQMLPQVFGRIIAKQNTAKWVMTFGNVWRVLIMGAFVLVLVPGVPVWVIYILTFLGGFFNSQQTVTQSAAPQIMLKANLRTLGNSVIQLGQNLGAGVGMAVFTLLVAMDPATGMRLCMIVSLVAWIVLLLITFLLKKPTEAEADAE